VWMLCRPAGAFGLEVFTQGSARASLHAWATLCRHYVAKNFGLGRIGRVWLWMMSERSSGDCIPKRSLGTSGWGRFGRGGSADWRPITHKLRRKLLRVWVAPVVSVGAFGLLWCSQGQ
jgi:hypothetical protein